MCMMYEYEAWTKEDEARKADAIIRDLSDEDLKLLIKYQYELEKQSK